MTIRDLAKKYKLTYQQVYYTIRDLELLGKITPKKIGNRLFVQGNDLKIVEERLKEKVKVRKALQENPVDEE